MQYASLKACAWQMRSVAALMLVVLVGIASSGDISAEILFQDDFERKTRLVSESLMKLNGCLYRVGNSATTRISMKF